MIEVYIVMGVSGSGKTTIGKLLARELRLPFYDADDFHPQSDINKMASGKPLDDNDRWPWLDILATAVKKWSKDGGAVLACSALKEVYRQRLFPESPALNQKNSPMLNPSRGSLDEKAKQNFIYLHSDFETIKSRVAQRKNHFFDSRLLQSQFDTLEVPDYGIKVDIQESKEQVLEEILSIIKER